MDNTSGEDWQAVKVGVGSSSALAFRYDLHSVRMVHRDILQTQERLALAPPTGGSTYRTDGDGSERVHVIDQMGAADLPVDLAQRYAMNDESGKAGTDDWKAVAMGRKSKSTTKSPSPASTGSVGSGLVAGVPAAQSAPGEADRTAETEGAGRANEKKDAAARLAQERRIKALADSLRKRGSNVIIEGFAATGEGDGQTKALERANNLRNELIKNGVPPAQVQAVARGVVAGQDAGVRLVAAAGPAGDTAAPAGAHDGQPVGESHFESQTPMSVARGTSAMVAILKDKATGEIVYLYDAESERGDGRYAFRSVLFRNPTNSTLETGPVTVYGKTRFIGEGLTEAIPPHATAVVPFALDRQIVIERDADEGDRIASLSTLSRGVLTCEVQHRRTTKLKITNRLPEATIVLVRHTTTRGWTVAKAPKDAEQYGLARLYRIKMAAGQTQTVEIEETTPLTRTLDLRSPDGLAMVETYLKEPDRAPAFAAQMDKLLELNRQMVDAADAIDSLRERGEEFRQRMDELHGQILSLGVTRTGGALTSNLRTKMKQISDKVQANTLAIVDKQEELMLARVGFQDGIAELTLGDAGKKTEVAAR